MKKYLKFYGTLMVQLVATICMFMFNEYVYRTTIGIYIFELLMVWKYTPLAQVCIFFLVIENYLCK